MPLNVVAIITPAAGKESRVEEILIDLAKKVHKHESEVFRYVPCKVVGTDGTPEFVVIERYKDKSALDGHFKTDHFLEVGKQIEAEGLMAKPLNIMTVEPLEGGFDSR